MKRLIIINKLAARQLCGVEQELDFHRVKRENRQRFAISTLQRSSGVAKVMWAAFSPLPGFPDTDKISHRFIGRANVKNDGFHVISITTA